MVAVPPANALQLGEVWAGEGPSDIRLLAGWGSRKTSISELSPPI